MLMPYTGPSSAHLRQRSHRASPCSEKGLLSLITCFVSRRYGTEPSSRDKLEIRSGPRLASDFNLPASLSPQDDMHLNSIFLALLGAPATLVYSAPAPQYGGGGTDISVSSTLEAERKGVGS
jgi:hypothetical protein